MIALWILGVLVVVVAILWACWQVIKASDAYSRERRHEQDRSWPRYKDGER